MAEWISTSWAAQRLGTSVATVRALISRGVLEGRVSPRPHRDRWAVKQSSVEAYLAEHGRIDLQRADRRTRRSWQQSLATEVEALRAEVAGLRLQVAALREQVEGYVPDTGDVGALSRCLVEATALRAALLELRARQAPLVEVSTEGLGVVEHLQATVAAQSGMIHNLRKALSLTDAAVGQFVVLGVMPES